LEWLTTIEIDLITKTDYKFVNQRRTETCYLTARRMSRRIKIIVDITSITGYMEELTKINPSTEYSSSSKKTTGRNLQHK